MEPYQTGQIVQHLCAGMNQNDLLDYSNGFYYQAPNGEWFFMYVKKSGCYDAVEFGKPSASTQFSAQYALLSLGAKLGLIYTSDDREEALRKLHVLASYRSPLGRAYFPSNRREGE